MGEHEDAERGSQIATQLSRDHVNKGIQTDVSIFRNLFQAIPELRFKAYKNGVGIDGDNSPLHFVLPILRCGSYPIQRVRKPRGFTYFELETVMVGALSPLEMLMAKRAAKKAGKPYPGVIKETSSPSKKKAAGKKSAVKKSKTFAAASKKKSAK